MFGSHFSAGLILPQPGLSEAQADPSVCLTDEAALVPEHGEDLRVTLLVEENALVAQGQPLMRLRQAPGAAIVAPMAGRVARIDLAPGRRLTQLVLFHDPDGDRYRFDTADALGGEADALRVLLHESGLWRAFRSRPFGRAPGPNESPAAIFVMAADSRPGAVRPDLAVAGREEDLERGLEALGRLADAPIYFCEAHTFRHQGAIPANVTRLQAGTRHPQGLAGFQLHRHFPARIGAPVWDVAAEDVADLGHLLASGYLHSTRLVALTGDALRGAKLVRCQPGADLRGLAQPYLQAGPHDVLSGSVLDGRPAHWLGPRDRLVTVLKRGATPQRRHWFGAALARAAHNAPIIPTAALESSMGGAALPAAALVRALAAGDAEAFMQLGGLSLVEEDLALADYVTGARPRLANQLRSLLDRIAQEEGTA
ncbi:Na(+)-translocating NADH-quinone reductase subunit A [Sedimentimonas flavescens]|uniref:Na(+)-translocating NADH-quinone reductase subunit A n=1 Tax=Sedimentimonas flavescens TaxID=2851012 RepID=UPI001C49F88D|nr:Na(+)-translocating NADH-quinone reductase subunit A [Sedimentimonas flavescens]MBW0159579.1 Na(+)-translocating NADH-quinone reductase subunit A [Sedimentimonas flavescens]